MDNWNKTLEGIIAFNTADGFIVTRFEDIVFCEARGSYTIVCLVGQELLVAKNLGTIAQRLPAELFLRSHDKYIVNKLHVQRFKSNGSLYLMMSNGKKAEVSTRKRQVVCEAFNRL